MLVIQVAPLVSSYQMQGWVVGKGVVEEGAVEVVVEEEVLPGQCSPWRGMEEEVEEEAVDLCPVH